MLFVSSHPGFHIQWPRSDSREVSQQGASSNPAYERAEDSIFHLAFETIVEEHVEDDEVFKGG